MKDFRDFGEMVRMLERLRGEGGCQWDRKQTLESIKDDLLGEVNELCEAVDRKDNENMKEEIGDCIWTLLFMAQIAKERGYFDVKDILTEVKDKMLRRHPHVFGDAKAATAEEALKLFNDVKRNERKSK
jgi:uncharacterized protein YabN with tetrapyrrole methylase and pyrophosphatase domain